MARSKFTPDQKVQIGLKSIRTNIITAKLCRKHNLNPQTFHTRRQKFMEAGKAGLHNSGRNDPVKSIKRERDNYKRTIGELTVANDALKKP